MGTLIKVAVIAGVGTAVGYFAYSWANSSYIPTDFQTGRQEARTISADILTLLDASAQNLQKISEADQKYDFINALELVYQELVRTRTAREKGINLTAALDKMARAVPGITPTKARNFALQAMPDGLALVTNLVAYSDTLNGLLETLRYKFSGDIRYDAQDVQKLVANLNDRGKEINRLNDVFNQKMEALDQMAARQ